MDDLPHVVERHMHTVSGSYAEIREGKTGTTFTFVDAIIRRRFHYQTAGPCICTDAATLEEGGHDFPLTHDEFVAGFRRVALQEPLSVLTFT